MAKLSHYRKSGEVQMVDVSAKQITTRAATAQASVRMKPAVVRAVRRLKNPKGNPLEVARISGIAAAKRTAEISQLSQRNAGHSKACDRHL